MPELTKVQQHLTALIAELKKNAKKLSETEFDDLLKDEVIPELIEHEQVFGTSILKKMEVIKTVQIDSILDDLGYDMERAIQHMNASAICFMVEYVNEVFELLEMIERKLKHNHDSEDLPYTMKFLDRKSRELSKLLLYDAFERNQLYESELKELNGRK